MPNKPKTPSRNVRVDAQLWEAAKRVAAERGESVADVIRRALEDYTSRQTCSHEWMHFGSAGDFWRECFLCGVTEDEPPRA